MGWCENIGKEKKLFVFLLFGFFSSHSTFLTVATSEIWLFMAWNCTTAETSKLTEEGNGGSAPAKNTTSPASWQEDSAIPVQLVFPSPTTLYIFRRSQEVYIQKVCFPAMNCTPWTPPQWYGKLCIGKNGRIRAGWPPGENVIPKVTSALTPHRKKEQDLLALRECLFYMCLLSATQSIISWRQRPQNTADNRTQTTVNRYMPDLVELQASAVDISLDYEFVSTSLE